MRKESLSELQYIDETSNDLEGTVWEKDNVEINDIVDTWNDLEGPMNGGSENLYFLLKNFETLIYTSCSKLNARLNFIQFMNNCDVRNNQHV